MERDWAHDFFDAFADASEHVSGLGVAALRSGPLTLQHRREPDSTFARMDRALPRAEAAESLHGDPVALFSCTFEQLAARVPTVELAGGVRRPAGSLSRADAERFRWKLDLDRHLLYGIDLDRRLGVTVTDQPDYSEISAPFRLHLQWLAINSGAALIHAATVGTRESGVLLIGSGGAGKSTTVCSCLSQGLVTCGDDYVWLESDTVGGGFRARQLYATVKTRVAAQRFLSPEITATIGPVESSQGKRLHYLAESVPAAFVAEMPIRAVGVLLPPDTPGEPVREIPKGTALRVGAPSTAMQASHDHQLTLRAMTAVIARNPCFGIRLVPDPDEQAAIIAGLAAELTQTP